MATTLPWMPTITQMVYLENCTGHRTKSRNGTDRERRAQIPPPTSMIFTGLFVLVTGAVERRWPPCTDYNRVLCRFLAGWHRHRAHTLAHQVPNYKEKGGTKESTTHTHSLNESTDCEYYCYLTENTTAWLQ